MNFLELAHAIEEAIVVVERAASDVSEAVHAAEKVKAEFEHAISVAQERIAGLRASHKGSIDKLHTLYSEMSSKMSTPGGAATVKPEVDLKQLFLDGQKATKK